MHFPELLRSVVQQTGLNNEVVVVDKDNNTAYVLFSTIENGIIYIHIDKEFKKEHYVRHS